MLGCVSGVNLFSVGFDLQTNTTVIMYDLCNNNGYILYSSEVSSGTVPVRRSTFRNSPLSIRDSGVSVSE